MFSPYLQEAMERGALVLTSTPRAGRALVRAWAEQRRAEGERSWRAPRIEDWRCWVDGLAGQVELGREVLTPLQELHLWGRVQTEEARLVVAPGRLAELACSAYGLLSAYRAHGGRRAGWVAAGWEQNGDAERFLEWADEFDRLCGRLGVMPRCGLEEALRERAGALRVEAEIVLVGFERLTPGQRALLEALPCRVARADESEGWGHGFGLAGVQADEPLQGSFPGSLQRSLQGSLKGSLQPPLQSLARLVEAGDEREELRACAGWVRGRLERAREAGDGSKRDDKPQQDEGPAIGPGIRLGVLVPDLKRMRAELDRVLRRTLEPESARAAASGRAPLYEFSLGIPLADVPLAAAALLLLRWVAEPRGLAAEEVSTLLLGGFAAASAEEALGLAEADAGLRAKGLMTREVSLRDLLRRAERMPDRGVDRVSDRGVEQVSDRVSGGLPDRVTDRVSDRSAGRGRALLPAGFAGRLREALEMARAAGSGGRSGREGRVLRSAQEDPHLRSEMWGTQGGRAGGRTGAQTHAEWAELVPELLRVAGWPGYGQLESVGFQARERWECLLEEVGAVSVVAGPVSLRGFVRELGEAARGVLFAAESRDAPVQVLGIAEAAGLEFDGVWVMGMGEGAWPEGGRVHPLLAPALQREAGMPHTSHEREQALARAQMGRVLRCAPEVVLSYARQGADGIANRPAPLAAELGLAAEEADAPAAEERRETVWEAVEADGPRWAVDQPELSPGGSEVLKRQAACAFQSFAARRLGAASLDEAAWGLDAAERGALLHRALERLWSTETLPGRLHTLADLQAARAAGTLEGMVREAVERAFGPAMREAAGDDWMTEYLRLEQRRVRTRLRGWLAVEAEREGFAVVELEKKVEARVGPLPLRLRMDRIDELEAGGRLLIDYKTGDGVSARQWEGERMEEPQLPIYAEFAGVGEVAGVAFGQIRPGKTKLHVLETTPEVREGWRASLTRLAEEFARGAAAVNPRDGAATCRMCGLEGVCRVREVEGE